MNFFDRAVVVGTMTSVLVSLLLAGCSDKSNVDSKVRPASVLATTSSTGGKLAEWGTWGDCFYTVPTHGRRIQVWRWSGYSFVSFTNAPSGGSGINYTWLPGDRILLTPTSPPEVTEGLLVLDCAGNRKEYLPDPPEWCSTSSVRLSRNGCYLSVCFKPENSRHLDRDHVSEHAFKEHTLCWVGRTTDPISEWITTPVITNRGDVALVSDDGAYLVVAENKLNMVNLKEKRLMWEKHFNDEYGYQGLAFSPDGKRLYAGGTKGLVLCLDVMTGERIGKPWVATDSGEPQYGQRIQEMAVSGDGKYVAAGTGPYGDTYVWRISDGKLVLKFQQGGMFGVLFSPDSTHLATWGAGTIKTWKLPVESSVGQFGEKEKMP